MESRARSIAKTFSWRFFATVITMIVAWIITGKPESGLVIGAVDTIIKLFGFYFHERAWNRISMDKIKPARNSVPQTVDLAVSQPKQNSPVMLVLSSNNKPEKATELALKKAAGCKRLVLVYVLKINLAQYFVGTDAGIYPGLKKDCEKEFMDKHREDAGKKVKAIVKRANSAGINVKHYIQAENFSLENNVLIDSEKPALIVLNRSKKSFQFRNLFKTRHLSLNNDIRIPVFEF